MKAWLFIAYKSSKHYEKRDFYFIKLFLDYNEMKEFSSKHSYKEKLVYPDYCSDYHKLQI